VQQGPIIAPRAATDRARIERLQRPRAKVAGVGRALWITAGAVSWLSMAA